MSGEQTVPAELDRMARAILTAGWRDEGYTVPNASVYPFQWLWDSCFHAIVWAHLGEPGRAVAELTHLFRTQDEVGFVPHIDYQVAPRTHADFWGRDGSSSITQPPMYGHAIAQLHRLGAIVPPGLIERARKGLLFLIEDRARDGSSGLITIVHPWESGADDSPRWDHWCGADFDPATWYEVKGRMMSTITRGPTGAPVGNAAFGAAPVSFNALVAFNLRELATVTGEDALDDHAADLFRRLRDRWDEGRRTWTDAGPAAATSGRVRTLDAWLVSLDAANHQSSLGDLVDDRQYGGRYGPAGVHRDEPTFAPATYWRGPAWPQLTYLLWFAARQRGDEATAAGLATRLIEGSLRTGFSEYWDPDRGTSLGARPQSWATLATMCAGSTSSPAP
jgi:hypothetical protein